MLTKFCCAGFLPRLTTWPLFLNFNGRAYLLTLNCYSLFHETTLRSSLQLRMVRLLYEFLVDALGISACDAAGDDCKADPSGMPAPQAFPH